MLVTVARTHWFGEDVDNIDTTLEAAPSLMPTFDRGPFGVNRFHDVIERRPTDGADPMHIGLVSKQYVLVQHASVVHAVTAEVTRAGIDPAQVPVSLLMTEYGTRIALRATLPENYAFTPDDGHSMALTFECFNSVDGTVPLFAAVGWFRFVCSNGLVVGATSARCAKDTRRRSKSRRSARCSRTAWNQRWRTGSRSRRGARRRSLAAISRNGWMDRSPTPGDHWLRRASTAFRRQVSTAARCSHSGEPCPIAGN